MATAPVFDFELLLAPISAEQPTGSDLREDVSNNSLFQRIQTERSKARSRERLRWVKYMSGEKMDPRELPDWKTLSKLCQEALTTRTKDFWLVAWLIEAECIVDGFAGLRDGFRLARQMSDRYWDTLWPRPDEDGWERTVCQLNGLTDSLESFLVSIPITASGYNLIHYTQAKDLEGRSDKEQRIAETGAVDMKSMEDAIRDTPDSVLRDLLDDIRDATTAWQELGEALDEKYRTVDLGAFPSTQFSQVLEKHLDRLREIFGTRWQALEASGTAVAAADAPATAGTVSASGGATVNTMSVTANAVASREEALRTLQRVATFFRDTEPHSPLSYYLEQAVRWGRMPLPQLIMELINDTGIREELSRRTGIPLGDGQS